jgi:hypothetical protein
MQINTGSPLRRDVGIAGLSIWKYKIILHFMLHKWHFTKMQNKCAVFICMPFSPMKEDIGKSKKVNLVNHF